MYVCICHQISEEKLQKVMETSKSPQEALKTLGLGHSCGTCLQGALEKVNQKIQTKKQISVPR